MANLRKAERKVGLMRRIKAEKKDKIHVKTLCKGSKNSHIPHRQKVFESLLLTKVAFI